MWPHADTNSLAHLHCDVATYIHPDATWIHGNACVPTYHHAAIYEHCHTQHHTDSYAHTDFYKDCHTYPYSDADSNTDGDTYENTDADPNSKPDPLRYFEIWV